MPPYTLALILLVGISSSCSEQQQREVQQQPVVAPEQQEAVVQQQNSFLTRYQYTQLHLGVQVRIVLFTEKEADAIMAATSAYAKIATLEDIFSNYRGDSEISRLTRSDAYEPVLVSKDLFEVVRYAQSVSSSTNGAFDITLGPYISLWKKARENKKLPNMIELESATDKVGWQLLKLDESNQSITLQQKSMELDLGGIAKGYILDKAMETLGANGIESALIEAGGDIVVSGPPPEKPGWNIEIQDADPDSEIVSRAKSLVHAAISTSGDTEQFVDIDGDRYSHIIDPSTGMGSTKRQMVTVIAPKGITSDSYATALGVMNEMQQAAFIQNHPDVLVYIRDSE